MTHYPMDSSRPNPNAIEDSAAPLENTDLLRKQLDEQRDLNLRLAEDFGDITRRGHHEAEARASAAKQAFVDGLLPPIDNLERALASGTSADSPVLRRGAEMALQQLRQLLRQNGVETGRKPPGPVNPGSSVPSAGRYNQAAANDAILEMLQRGKSAEGMVLRNTRPPEVVPSDSKQSRLLTRGDSPSALR